VVIGNGRIVAQGTKAELLEAAGTVVRAAETVTLGRALQAAGLTVTASQDGALRTDADAARVGEIALAAGIPLIELKSADGAGLEEMFLELTAESQREGVAA